MGGEDGEGEGGGEKGGEGGGEKEGEGEETGDVLSVVVVATYSDVVPFVMTVVVVVVLKLVGGRGEGDEGGGGAPALVDGMVEVVMAMISVDSRRSGKLLCDRHDGREDWRGTNRTRVGCSRRRQ